MKGSISIGTIIFWLFMGWLWFGDDIKETFHEITTKNLAVQVSDDNIAIDVDKVIENAVEKAKSVISSEEKQDEKEKPKPSKREKTMVAEPEQDSNDNRYGDFSNKDKY